MYELYDSYPLIILGIYHENYRYFLIPESMVTLWTKINKKKLFTRKRFLFSDDFKLNLIYFFSILMIRVF